MYLVHALILVTVILKIIIGKEWPYEKYHTGCITNYCRCGTLKKWTWFDDKVPTALTVIILSLTLCPAGMLGMAAYYGVPIEHFMLFASFIAAFIVALVSMDGWERVMELAERFIKKG